MKLYILNAGTLPDPKDIKKCDFPLPDGRFERAIGYKNADDRKRSLGAGILMEKIASGKEILLSGHKKPYVDGIFFNISHSGDFAVGCLAKSEVGCDIEKIKDAPSNVAKRFSDGEKAYIDGAKDRSFAFFEIWTMRESYMKMTGEGLLVPLRDFEVMCGENPDIIRDGKRQNCFLKSISYGDYIISVCCKKYEEIEIVEI